MKVKTLLFLLIIVSTSAYSQLFDKENMSWYIKPSAGINFSLTDNSIGEITDYITTNDKIASYFQWSGGVFINKNWGIELSFAVNSSANTVSRGKKFATELASTYRTNYYADYDFYKNTFEDEEYIFRSSIGVAYKLEKSDFIFITKLFFTNTSISRYTFLAELKENGTNNNYLLLYTPNTDEESYYSLSPAVTFGYSINKKFVANLDVQYIYFKSDFSYTEELENLFTEEKSTITYNYNSNNHIITLGLGITYLF